MTRPFTLGMRALRSSLSEGELKAPQVWQLLAQRARELEPLRAFVRVCEAPPDLRPGPLEGIPLAVKDLFTDGPHIPTAGSDVVARPGNVALILARLRMAGAGVLGYTNLHEWAVGLTSSVTATGPIRNPWDPEVIAGGSSGGSAVAVAAGAAPGAIGTDAGGSIRCPAACCGIVGFKPTFGSVPSAGYVAAGAPIDHIGCLARNVADVRVLFEVISGTLSGSVDVAGLRLGIARTQFFDHATAEVARAVEPVVERLAHSARSVRDVEIEGAAAAGAVLPLIYLPHVARLVDQLGDASRLQPQTQFLLDLGRSLTRADRAVAEETRVSIRRGWMQVFEEVDVVVSPTLPFGPPAVADPAPDLDYLPFTAPMNLGGVPALTLPCAETSSWWPASVTVSAAPGNDAISLAVGELIEQQQERTFADRVVDPLPSR